MKTRFQKSAALFAESFETRLRDNGEAFVCLQDGSPDWMREAIQAAHDNGDRLPCDYIYGACHSAADYIAENCDGEGDDESAFDFADSFVSVYNGERAAWLAMHLGNAEYVDDAIKEGLTSLEDGIYPAIAVGMLEQAREIFAAIYSAIEEAAEDMSFPFVAGWNMPGYMPDGEPGGFDTFAEAKAYIIDELKQAEDDAGERGDEEAAEEYCHTAEDVNLKSSPFEIIAGPYCFFVMESSE